MDKLELTESIKEGESTSEGQSEVILNSPVISYVYSKLTDEKEFKRNLAAKIYSNSSFTSTRTGKLIGAETIAKDAIYKANVFWDSLPKDWKSE